MTKRYEMIIIGGGPAGLTAGMYAARSKLSAVVLERGLPGGQLLNTKDIEDYPGFLHVGGFELAELMTKHAEKFGCEIATETVTRIARNEDDDPWARWRVETESGPTYVAPMVILSAGGTAIKLGVPGELEFAGRGVSYCAVCDGAFFEGETIAVVGGGDAAAEEADFLTRYAEKVYLIHRRDALRSQKIIQERVLRNPKIQVLWDTIVREATGDEKGLNKLLLQGTRKTDGSYEFDGTGPTRELPVTGLFVFIGFEPNTHLLDGNHVRHDAGGHFLTDERMETNLPGLYAVGDVRSQLVRQITTAVGDATTAAIAVEKAITELKESHPQPQPAGASS
ncbi:MAG: FAD-dependent oxidoreductase [Gemmatimonadetes bacterium]|nr:FAD-dependent oxidoreductase [Gemmatimonadota bacterium]